ncbi:MAG: pyridoxamine 5'-phosphate oxidase family protein [Thomasclavelia sp.]
MFRPVRKKINEIKIEEAKKLLHQSRRGVLAVNGDNNYPYAIPVNYLYDEENQKIYFHGSRAGHKVDAIKNCDKVCFTVIGNETIKKETWAPFLQSAVIFGRCHLIQDQSIAMALLKKFAMKFYPSESMVDEEIAVFKKAMQMYEIEIEHLSGKEVQER